MAGKEGKIMEDYSGDVGSSSRRELAGRELANPPHTETHGSELDAMMAGFQENIITQLSPPEEISRELPAEPMDLLVDALRAINAGDEELAIDVLLRLEGQHIDTAYGLVNKFSAMVVGRGSVDQMEKMLNQKLKKKEKESTE
jgi:hypothetical protein